MLPLCNVVYNLKYALCLSVTTFRLLSICFFLCLRSGYFKRWPKVPRNTPQIYCLGSLLYIWLHMMTVSYHRFWNPKWIYIPISDNFFSSWFNVLTIRSFIVLTIISALPFSSYYVPCNLSLISNHLYCWGDSISYICLHLPPTTSHHFIETKQEFTLKISKKSHMFVT